MVRTISVPSMHPGEHGAPITDVAVRPDGRKLATASYDGTVVIWDVVGSGTAVPRTAFRHRRLVNGVSWNPKHPDLVASASADKTVAIWNITRAARPESVLGRHTDDMNSVAWLPDGQRVVCVSEDGAASLWDALSGRYLGPVAAHTAHCMDVAVNDSGLIATVGEDGLTTLSRLRDETGTIKVASRQYQESIEACSWSESGSQLALASDAGCVYLVDSELRDVRTFAVSGSAVRSVAWRECDRELVVGAYDGCVYFLDSDTGQVRAVHDNPQAWPRSVSCGGDIVAIGSFGSVPELLLPGAPGPHRSSSHRTFGPNALATDGTALFVGCDSGTVFRIPLRRSSELDIGAATAHEISDAPILSLVASGGLVFAGTYGGRVVCMTETGDLRDVAIGAPIPSLTLLAEGRLAAGTYGGEIVVLDQDLRTCSRRTAHHGSIKSLATAGGWILSAATDRTVAASRHSRQHVVWEHGNLVNSIAYDGGYLASASRDHTVKVAPLGAGPHHCSTTEAPLTLLGPDESIKCVALLAGDDAVTVLAGSYDFSLWAWQISAADGQHSLQSGMELTHFDQGVSCLCRLSSSTVVAASWDGTLQVVQLRSGRPAPVERYALRDVVSLAKARP